MEITAPFYLLCPLWRLREMWRRGRSRRRKKGEVRCLGREDGVTCLRGEDEGEVTCIFEEKMTGEEENDVFGME